MSGLEGPHFRRGVPEPGGPSPSSVLCPFSAHVRDVSDLREGSIVWLVAVRFLVGGVVPQLWLKNLSIVAKEYLTFSLQSKRSSLWFIQLRTIPTNPRA